MLDVASGYGRNAAALVSRGCNVVCADRELGRLRYLDHAKSRVTELQCQTLGNIYSVCADLCRASWPFGTQCFDAIICVHYVRLELLDLFSASLRSCGHLYFETFDGQGENYLALPPAGYVRELLLKDFELRFYREQRVGPPSSNAVSVRLYACKRR